MLCPWLSDDIVHNSVCSFWELDCCFLSSCWIIDQSYHYTSRPSIYSTIRIVVLLMGLSISLCEGQSNTCINRRLTHMYTQTQTLSCRCMSVCACVCVFLCVCVKGVEGHPHGSRLFFNSGLRTSENVLTSWRHMLAQQYYRNAAVLQHLKRLQIKHILTHWSPVATVCEGCYKGKPSWLLSVCAFICVLTFYNLYC